MCNCVKELNKKLSEKMGSEGEIVNIDLFSGRILSTFEYKQGKKNKSIRVMHAYCPVCGQKYDDEQNGSRANH